MKLLDRVKRLVAFAEYACEAEGRKILVRRSKALEPDVRVTVAAKWAFQQHAPIVISYNPTEQGEDLAESLAWALGNIVLGHLRTDTHHMTISTLRVADRVDVSASGAEILAACRADSGWKALVWAAYLMVGIHQAELRGDPSIATTFEISRRIGMPARLVALWQRCQTLPDETIEDLIGRPAEWALAAERRERTRRRLAAERKDYQAEDSQNTDVDDELVDGIRHDQPPHRK